MLESRILAGCPPAFAPGRGDASFLMAPLDNGSLVQCSYASPALASLIANPQDRSEHVKKVAKKLGGKISGSWLSFGEHDLVMIVEMPDNISVAALSLAAAAGGSLKSIKTTPLISIADGLTALKKAATSGYTPIEA